MYKSTPSLPLRSAKTDVETDANAPATKLTPTKGHSTLLGDYVGRHRPRRLGLLHARTRVSRPAAS